MGTAIFAFLAEVEHDLFKVESLSLLLLACIPEATGVLCCSRKDDSSAVIWGEGWPIFSGLGYFILGVRLDLLPDDDFVVVIVILWVDEEESVANERVS